MNFQEAKQIAKDRPGSVVTRSADGSFVVLDENGSEIESVGACRDDGPGETEYAFRQRCEALETTLSEVRARASKDEKEFKKEITGLKERIRVLQEQLTENERQLKRVTEDDWAAIEAREKEEKLKLMKERKDERRTVTCPCKGEVENCQMCYGKGYYEADGYGNPI